MYVCCSHMHLIYLLRRLSLSMQRSIPLWPTVSISTYCTHSVLHRNLLKETHTRLKCETPINQPTNQPARYPTDNIECLSHSPVRRPAAAAADPQSSRTLHSFIYRLSSASVVCVTFRLHHHHITSQHHHPQDPPFAHASLLYLCTKGKLRLYAELSKNFFAFAHLFHHPPPSTFPVRN